jgi:serine/threonine protein phosphatase PrpC/LysM repeat protein
MKVSYCSKSDIGTKFPINTDAFGDKITRNGHVFVVADGCPIDENGSFVSKLAVQSVLDFFEKELIENIYIGINHAFQFTNEQLYRTILSHENLKGTYVSMAIVVVRNEGAYYGYVGNAKVAIQSEDVLTQLTTDHGFLDVQPYQVGGVQHKIVKALGNTPSVYPSVCNAPILGNQGDVIVLSTQGLFKAYNLNSLNDKIDYSTINRDIIGLIDVAKGTPSSDNLTLFLIAVTEGNDLSLPKTIKNQTIKPVQTQEEIKKQLFNLADMDRKKMILIGGGIIAFLLVIWFAFRQPKDDTDMVFEENTETIKADTTNPNADLENMMEYETPKEKKKTEEEEVNVDEELNAVETSDEEQVNEEAEVKDPSNLEQPKKEDKPTETKKEEKSAKTSGSHTVKSGDNLGRIAEKYHVKIDALRKANNLKDDQINIGQELKIPN